MPLHPLLYLLSHLYNFPHTNLKLDPIFILLHASHYTFQSPYFPDPDTNSLPYPFPTFSFHLHLFKILHTFLSFMHHLTPSVQPNVAIPSFIHVNTHPSVITVHHPQPSPQPNNVYPFLLPVINTGHSGPFPQRKWGRLSWLSTIRSTQ